MSTPFCLMMVKMDGLYTTTSNKILLNIKRSLLKVIVFLVDYVFRNLGFCTELLTLWCFRLLYQDSSLKKLVVYGPEIKSHAAISLQMASC